MSDLLAFLKRNHALPRAPREAEAAAAASDSPSSPVERSRRSTRKRRRHATLQAPALPSVYSGADASAVQNTAVEEMRLASFDDLVREFPHLRTGLGVERKEPAAAAEAAPAAPWLHEAFTAMINELPNVRLIGHDIGGAGALDWLKSRLTVLPLLTSDFEANLLKEAGTFALPDGRRITYPRCRKGNQCAARLFPIPGAPQPCAPALTQLIFPHEWAILMETGAPPVEHRMCILCCRLATYQLVLALRWYADTARLAPDVMVQVYRNAVDQAGGYRRDLCVLPTSGTWEGFIDPVVMFKPSLMRWVNEHGRWGINQDLLLFRPLVHLAPGDLEPRPFETPLDFRVRSERLLWGSVRHQPLHPVRELLCGAAPRSLRAFFAANAKGLPSQPWLDRATAQGYEGQLLLDAVLRGRGQRLAVDAVVCEELTVTPLCHAALLRSSMWRATGNATVPAASAAEGQEKVLVTALSHLFSKGAPQRCQTRKFSAVCMKLIEQHSELALNMRCWVLCSLLGNYRHVLQRSDYRPASPAVRRRLYEMLGDHPDEHWPTVLHRLQPLLVFVVREVMVAEIHGSPSMQCDLETRLNWPAFASAVSATLAVMREAVYHALDHGTEWPTEAQFAAIAERGHHDVLAVAQRRPTRPLTSLITGQALRARMATLPPVSAAVQRVLHEWTRALPPGPAEVGVQFVPWLDAFGISAEAQRAFWDLCVACHHETPSRRDLTDQLMKLADAHPAAVSLAHAWCKAHQHAQRSVRWALPEHYALHQMDAVRTRLKLEPGMRVPDFAVSVMVCRGCGRLFDATWMWKLPTRTKPLRVEHVATRGARIDLITEQIICDHCVFAKNPVTTVDVVCLLGCAMVCKDNLVLLCPQPGCGLPMALDARCRYTERGVACASCSLAFYERPKAALKWDKTCALCRHNAREPRLFPFGLTVCGYHVREEVTEVWSTQKPATREAGLELLRTYAGQLKEVVWAAGAKRRRRDLNASRRTSRMTSRQRFYDRFQ